MNSYRILSNLTKSFKTYDCIQKNIMHRAIIRQLLGILIKNNIKISLDSYYDLSLEELIQRCSDELSSQVFDLKESKQTY